MMNSKMMASGGMSKMMASGGMAKAKMMASGGMPKALKAHADKPASKAHAGLKSGGMAMVMKDGKKVPSFAADGVGKMKAGGMAKMMSSGGMTKMGSVKTSPKTDGVATKGKTKGTMVKMARGGKAC